MKKDGTHPPEQPGERWTGSGWQVYVHRRGKFISKHFPPDTPLLKRRAWRLDQKHSKNPETPDKDGSTLAADVEAYLEAVRSMPSYQDRKLHMDEWRDALGPYRSRASITPVEIRLELEKQKRRGLSNGSLNRRRTALMSFYTTLNGKSGANPVRDVPKYHETVAPLLLPTLEQAEAAISQVPTRKGRTKTQARLKVLLWTGWPAAQLGRLKRDHVNGASAYVTARRKGRGAKGRWLPLLPQAVEALKAFDAANAWGPFSTSAAHSLLARGCEAAGVPVFNPYALRHLFLTMVAQTVKDDRVVAELAMHSKLEMARRYTEQSVDPRLASALKKLTDDLA